MPLPCAQPDLQPPTRIGNILPASQSSDCHGRCKRIRRAYEKAKRAGSHASHTIITGIPETVATNREPSRPIPASPQVETTPRTHDVVRAKLLHSLLYAPRPIVGADIRQPRCHIVGPKIKPPLVLAHPPEVSRCRTVESGSQPTEGNL